MKSNPRRPCYALCYDSITEFVQTSNVFVFLQNAHIDQNINILWKVWGLHNLTMWYSWQLQIQIQILETWCAMKGNMFSKEVGLNEKPSDSSIRGWGWSPAWWGCNPTWRREHVQVGKNSRDDCSCTGCLVAEIPPPEEILEFSTGFCCTKCCRSWSWVCGPVDGNLGVVFKDVWEKDKMQTEQGNLNTNNWIPTSSCDIWRTNLPKKQQGEPNQISKWKGKQIKWWSRINLVTEQENT